jgi:hypothetical protein
MYRDSNHFVKGIFAGLIVGAAVSMLTNGNSRNRSRFMRRNAGKAVRFVGNIVENAIK